METMNFYNETEKFLIKNLYGLEFILNVIINVNEHIIIKLCLQVIIKEYNKILKSMPYHQEEFLYNGILTHFLPNIVKFYVQILISHSTRAK